MGSSVALVPITMMRTVYLLAVTLCLLALAAEGTEARPQFFDAVGDFVENVGEGVGNFFEGVGDFFSGLFAGRSNTRSTLASRPAPPPLTFNEAINSNDLRLVID